MLNRLLTCGVNAKCHGGRRFHLNRAAAPIQFRRSSEACHRLRGYSAFRNWASRGSQEVIQIRFQGCPIVPFWGRTGFSLSQLRAEQTKDWRRYECRRQFPNAMRRNRRAHKERTMQLLLLVPHLWG